MSTNQFGIMEFQAVVLAGGKGSRMNELTRGKTPKCLLPIGNKPMVWFPLKMLESHGFAEAIVIVLEPHKSSVLKALSDAGGLKIKVEIVEIPDADWGTADALRHKEVKDKLTHDVLVVSCDVVTNFPLQQLADAFRIEDAALSCLLSPFSKQWAEASAPGPKTKRKGASGERDFVGIEPESNRLLFLANEADVEDEVITFKKALFNRHPRVLMRSKILDAHVYLMRRWVLDFLDAKKTKATLKGEFIPYLLAKQFSAHSKKGNSSDAGGDQPQLNGDVSMEGKKIGDFFEEDPWMESLRELSNASSLNALSLPRPSPVRCNAAFTSPANDDFCVRVNTTATFCEINKSVLKLMPDLFQDASSKSPTPEAVLGRKSESESGRKSESDSIPTSSKIMGDSIVGEGTKLGVKTIIKKSVIGKDCQIGDHVKIENCVLLDGVCVGSKSHLTGSLALEESTVGKGVEMKDSLVGFGVAVEDNLKVTNEALVKNMMEI